MRLFREDVEEAWQTWFGVGHPFKFDEMHTTLIRVMNCEDLSPQVLSAKAGRLLQIYQQEMSRFDAKKTKGGS